MIPSSTPKMNRTELVELINKHYPNYMNDFWQIDKFATIWIRGYYKNSMGKVNKNDRAIYDDACFIMSVDELHSFNANTDPSKYQHAIATLKPNAYRGVYKFDNHNGSKGSYPAICQRLGKVTVIRDGKGEDTGMFGINQHKGGNKTTSSLGCQTIPPTQWDRFYATAKRLFGATKNVSPTMILIEI